MQVLYDELLNFTIHISRLLRNTYSIYICAICNFIVTLFLKHLLPKTHPKPELLSYVQKPRSRKVLVSEWGYNRFF